MSGSIGIGGNVGFSGGFGANVSISGGVSAGAYFGAPVLIPFGAAGPVILGDFVFQGFEVPASVEWSGAQRLVVHKLPGGNRVVDVLGRDDDPIQWGGTFLSADASLRADTLDQMRAAGAPLELNFAGRDYTVIIDHLQLDQRKINHVRYRVSCTVLADRTDSPAQTQPTAAAAISGDVTAGLNVAAIAPLSAAVSGPLLSAQASLSGQVSLSAGTGLTLGLNANVGAALGGVTAQFNAANLQMGGFVNAGTGFSLLGTVDVPGTLSAMTTVGAASAALAMSNVQAGFLGRAQINLGNL